MRTRIRFLSFISVTLFSTFCLMACGSRGLNKTYVRCTDLTATAPKEIRSEDDAERYTELIECWSAIYEDGGADEGRTEVAGRWLGEAYIELAKWNFRQGTETSSNKALDVRKQYIGDAKTFLEKAGEYKEYLRDAASIGELGDNIETALGQIGGITTIRALLDEQGCSGLRNKEDVLRALERISSNAPFLSDYARTLIERIQGCSRRGDGCEQHFQVGRRHYNAGRRLPPGDDQRAGELQSAIYEFDRFMECSPNPEDAKTDLGDAHLLLAEHYLYEGVREGSASIRTRQVLLERALGEANRAGDLMPGDYRAERLTSEVSNEVEALRLVAEALESYQAFPKRDDGQIKCDGAPKPKQKDLEKCRERFRSARQKSRYDYISKPCREWESELNGVIERCKDPCREMKDNYTKAIDFCNEAEAALQRWKSAGADRQNAGVVMDAFGKAKKALDAVKPGNGCVTQSMLAEVQQRRTRLKEMESQVPCQDAVRRYHETISLCETADHNYDSWMANKTTGAANIVLSRLERANKALNNVSSNANCLSQHMLTEIENQSRSISGKIETIENYLGRDLGEFTHDGGIGAFKVVTDNAAAIPWTCDAVFEEEAIQSGEVRRYRLEVARYGDLEICVTEGYALDHPDFKYTGQTKFENDIVVYDRYIWELIGSGTKVQGIEVRRKTNSPAEFKFLFKLYPR